MGPYWGQPLPHTLCFSSFLKYLDNSFWCTFPELLTWKPSPNGRYEVLNDHEDIAPRSTAHSPGNCGHCDNCPIILPPIRELCMSWSHTPSPFPYLGFKNAILLFKKLKIELSHDPAILLLGTYPKKWNIYNGILLSHKEEQNWVICRDVDAPRDCHTEWSKRKTNTMY